MSPRGRRSQTDAEGPESVAALRERLREAEELIDAIRSGEVDALVHTGAEAITPLQGADEPYRHTVETMLEGALTLTADGTILYCNARFAELTALPAAQIIGTPLRAHLAEAAVPALEELIAAAFTTTARGRLALQRPDGTSVPVMLAIRRVTRGDVATLVAAATDLSELEQAQGERDHLARIVETARDGIIGMDLDGIITSWNRGATELYGYTAEQMIGSPEGKLAPPELKEESAELVRRAGAGEAVIAHETRRLTRDGQRIDVALTLSPIADAAGRIVGVSKIAHNLSEARRAQRERDESERRFHALLDNMQLIAVMLDDDARITYCNDYLLKLTGWAREDVIGNSWFECFIPPDARAKVQEIHAAMLAGNAAARHHENEILTRDGKCRLIRWDNTQLFGPDGRVLGGAAVGADITEYRRASEALKASELRFRKLIENASDVIAITELDGTVRFVSPSVRTIAGYRPQELQGRNVLELLHPDELETAMQELPRLQAQAGETIHTEHRYRHSDGHWLIMDVVASNQVDTPGIEGLVVTLHDVTALRQSAGALGERVKEQRCLYQVAKLAGDSGLSESDLLARIPALLAASLQYPDITAARVRCGQYSFETAGFSTTPGLLAAELRVDGRVEGWLEVCYQQERAAAAKGPFLAEERVLLESVADTLGQALDTRRAQQALSSSQRLLETVLNAMPVRVFWKDRELVFLGCNMAFARDAGFAHPRELVGKTDEDMHWHELAERYRADDRAVIESGEPKLLIEEPQTTPDGNTITLLTSKVPLRAADGSTDGVLGAYMDITEQKRATDAVVAREREYRTLFETSQDALMTLFPPDWHFASANPATLALFGLDSEESFCELRPWDVSPERQPDGKSSATEAVRMIEAAMHQGAQSFDWTHCRADGAPFPATVLLTRVDIAGRAGLQVTVRDISAQKAYEQTLQRLNRALGTLSAGNTAVVHARTEQQLLQQMCQVLVETGGFRMAWVGLAEHDAASTVRPVAWNGAGTDYLEQISISWADDEGGRGPTGRCIRSGETQLARDIATDPTMAPWREAALEHGLQSSVALPLRTSAGIIGALNIYAADPNAFQDDELSLLRELTGDLAYGIEALRTRAAQEQGVRQLARGLDATVEALAHTVELRDPYTAGHQRRVAEIAVAIAGALSWSDDRVKGLRLAAAIHDIGKISTPAEILAKPTRLTPLEYKLVQGHAEAGYALLRDVEFPWPIADMIHQHHERMDGSGYPLGLTGEQILPEARILAVADVVEAMASHRPYRAAKGIDVALDEISRGRGTHFDPEIVDACLRLFREQGFVLPVQ